MAARPGEPEVDHRPHCVPGGLNLFRAEERQRQIDPVDLAQPPSSTGSGSCCRSGALQRAADESEDDEFRLAPGETLAGLPADYEPATGETDEAVADIIRESLDGATLYPLMAAAEQWPDPWFEPWEPAAPAGCGLRPSDVVPHRPDVVEALLRTGPTLEAWPPIPC
ncbi:hypothetical protein [Streptomyces sp. NPDC059874]|uniref:hypothetical protein n=1 Tax=Streptomyces sp. NPDC059874 TaxID=3346983 RepID=UPI003647D52A